MGVGALSIVRLRKKFLYYKTIVLVDFAVMCKYDIEAYYKVTYDIMAILYCYLYHNMQLFMLCTCIFSRKKVNTNAAFMALFLMYTSNMSSKFAFFRCLIAEITLRNHVWIIKKWW